MKDRFRLDRVSIDKIASLLSYEKNKDSVNAVLAALDALYYKKDAWLDSASPKYRRSGDAMTLRGVLPSIRNKELRAFVANAADELDAQLKPVRPISEREEILWEGENSLGGKENIMGMRFYDADGSCVGQVVYQRNCSSCNRDGASNWGLQHKDDFI